MATDGHRLAFASQGAGRQGAGRRTEGHRAAQGAGRGAEADGRSVATRTRSSSASRTTRSSSSSGEHKLTSNLLEGNFPRYENVMPESSDDQDLAPDAKISPTPCAVSRCWPATGTGGRSGSASPRASWICPARPRWARPRRALSVDYEGDRDGDRLQRPLPAGLSCGRG